MLLRSFVIRTQLRALVTIQTLRAYEAQPDACPPAIIGAH